LDENAPARGAPTDGARPEFRDLLEEIVCAPLKKNEILGPSGHGKPAVHRGAERPRARFASRTRSLALRSIPLADVVAAPEIGFH